MKRRRNDVAPARPVTLARDGLIQRSVASAWTPMPSAPGFAHDFSRVPAWGPDSLLSRAAAESSRPLDSAVREQIEPGLGWNLGGIRLHSGPASAAAAAFLGARAYTLGHDIYLGAEARGLAGPARLRLLAHEAVHTVQQAGNFSGPGDHVAVSSPDDASEREAQQVAEGITAPPGGGASFPEAAPRGAAVSRVGTPTLQRDLTKEHAVKNGKFLMNLKTESHPGDVSGMSGTITFRANEKAPDSKSIRLLQVVRDENLTTGKEVEWTGGEANRNKMQTTADPKRGIEGGYFVDHSAAAATPRTKAADKAVSPYYRDYWPNASKSQDGSKSGKTVSDASLWDSPGSNGNRRFSFETMARGADTGITYGTVKWGFTISDAAKGKIESERSAGQDATTATSDEAIKQFNEFYKNPGASTAPK